MFCCRAQQSHCQQWLTKSMAGCKGQESCKPCQDPSTAVGTPTAGPGAVYKVILGDPGIPGAAVHPLLWLLRSWVCWTWPHAAWGFRGWWLWLYTSKADTERGVLWQQGAASNGFHLSAPHTHHAWVLAELQWPTLFLIPLLQCEQCMTNVEPCTHGCNLTVPQSAEPAHQSTGVTLNCFYSICFIMLLQLSSDTVLINSIPSSQLLAPTSSPGFAVQGIVTDHLSQRL